MGKCDCQPIRSYPVDISTTTAMEAGAQGRAPSQRRSSAKTRRSAGRSAWPYGEPHVICGRHRFQPLRLRSRQQGALLLSWLTTIALPATRRSYRVQVRAGDMLAQAHVRTYDTHARASTEGTIEGGREGGRAGGREGGREVS